MTAIGAKPTPDVHEASRSMWPVGPEVPRQILQPFSQI
jgi:hypothetical protein